MVSASQHQWHRSLKPCNHASDRRNVVTYQGMKLLLQVLIGSLRSCVAVLKSAEETEMKKVPLQALSRQHPPFSLRAGFSFNCIRLLFISGLSLKAKEEE